MRFQRWLMRQERHISKSRIVSAVLILTFAFVLIYSFYTLSIIWFKHDFSRATYDLAQRQATTTVKNIEDLLLRTEKNKALSVRERQKMNRALDNLVEKNQGILAAMVVDRDGRIALASDLGGTGNGIIIKQTSRFGRSLIGYDADSLIKFLSLEHPSIASIHFALRPGGQPIGTLNVLVDRDVSREAVEIAASQMTARLALLLILCLILIGLAIIVIRRQQRLARHLIEQRNSAEHLAYVGALAAGLAHEIRNPLNALAMQLELLEEDVGEGAPELVAPRLQRIRKGLAGVERTVHDFLNYASPGQQKPSMVELASVLIPMCNAINESLEYTQGRVECTVAPGLHAWCDAHALRQILSNLVSNGLRAQNSKGVLEPLRVEAARDGTWVNINVDDAGAGVPPEMRERVFECFFTTQSEGTGLGLPIARRLTEMNSGRLELAKETSPLGGARFILRLPVRPASNRV